MVRIRPALVLLAATLLLPCARAAEKPKVRAITAFVRLDRDHYQQQIRETLDFLHAAKAEFERGGYEVQTIRISTQPFPEYVRGLSPRQALELFRQYDALARKEGFDASIGTVFVGSPADREMVDLLAEILASTRTLNASVSITSDTGVNWNAVAATARLIKALAERTPHSQGNFNFTAAAMVPPLTPFYPASYHLGPGRQFAVALQSANVVAEAFTAPAGGAVTPDSLRQPLQQLLTTHASKIQEIASAIEKRSGWSYAGLDLSPAPLKDVSIGAAIEAFAGATFGSSGTLTAAAAITAVLKAIPVKQTGYSGLMLPVLEDELLARRWGEGKITLDSLLAYSAVCGTGLDTIPLPGDITEQQIARILGDVASLAVKWRKPLSARLLPVAGKKAGERTEFDDPFLVNTTIQPFP